MSAKESYEDLNSWPSPFRELFKLFFQINTHLTFLASRSRSTIPSYELLQKLNPAITKEILGSIKFLLPNDEVFYSYVDENQLMLSFAEKVQYDRRNSYKQQKPNSIDETYENMYHQQNDNEKNNSNLRLVFDFRDTKMYGIGGAIKGSKRRKTPVEEDRDLNFFLSTKELSLQNISRNQLLSIIKGRNEKFKKCVMEFLSSLPENEKGQAGNEAFKVLLKLSQDLIPRIDPEDDPTDILVQEDQQVNIDGKPDLNTMMNVLMEKPFYRKQIVTSRTLNEKKEAACKVLDDSTYDQLHPELVHALKEYKGIDVDSDLYTHQADALTKILNERNSNVIVSTSTSSGKSLIYQIPILNDILWDNSSDRKSTAIFIFPTKALAQDQKRHLNDFILHIPFNHKRKIIVDTYDGDTPAKDRSFIRDYADIIFTNPDTIHASLLPNHDKYTYNDGMLSWHNFFLNMKYVVMDELHVYKGTFGIHVGYVMSRMRRLIEYISLGIHENEKKLQFISCSATIQDPIPHFRAVSGSFKEDLIFHLSEDGSPCAEKKMVIWNPPPLMNKRGQTQTTLKSSTSVKKPSPLNEVWVPRENIILELAKILLHLLAKFPSIKIIIFCPIRAVCELMIKEVRTLLVTQYKELGISISDIMSYRGGYSKNDRRIIERKLFNGQVRAVIATNALELGIDLSELDVVISCGFPMLKLNLHQQFGRAGRSRTSKGSLAIFVGGPLPLDQYYMNHPDALGDKSSYEDLCVDSLMQFGSNQLIMEKHVECAAFEWPLDINLDMQWFSYGGSIKTRNLFKKICEEELLLDDNGFYRTHPKYLPFPADYVSLRDIEDTHYAVVDITDNKNIVIEEVEELRTSFTLYEGGIFLHQGFPYLIKEFNFDDHFAKVERVNVDWITSQRDFTDVDPLEIEYVKHINPLKIEKGANKSEKLSAFYGKIQTTIIVFGFFKVNRRGEILEAVEVNNPPVILKSKGLWIDIPNFALEIIREKKLSSAGGIHAAEHALMNVLPLFINGASTAKPNGNMNSNIGVSELMTECKAPEKEFAKRQSRRQRPARLIFYDAKGGQEGSGVSFKSFELLEDILYATYLRIEECECDWGCPSCVTPSFCSEMLYVMSKPAAIIILASLLSMNLERVKKQVPDGPEGNMAPITIETIIPSNQPVKYSKEVEIIETRTVSPQQPFIIKKENSGA